MKKRKRGNKSDKFFLLNWRKTAIILIIWIAAVILHNVIYGLFKTWFDARGGDEAFFFIIAVFIIPLYFLICMLYTLFKKLKK